MPTTWLIQLFFNHAIDVISPRIFISGRSSTCTAINKTTFCHIFLSSGFGKNLPPVMQNIVAFRPASEWAVQLSQRISSTNTAVNLEEKLFPQTQHVAIVSFELTITDTMESAPTHPTTFFWPASASSARRHRRRQYANNVNFYPAQESFFKHRPPSSKKRTLDEERTCCLRIDFFS